LGSVRPQTPRSTLSYTTLFRSAATSKPCPYPSALTTAPNRRGSTNSARRRAFSDSWSVSTSTQAVRLRGGMPASARTRSMGRISSLPAIQAVPLLERLAHDGPGVGDPGPAAEGDLGLGYQHVQAVSGHEPPVAGRAYQRSHRRHVDEVEHGGALGEEAHVESGPRG